MQTSLLFAEALNPEWGSFSVFEWLTLEGQGNFYVDGQTNNLVRWSIVNAAANHNNVVEVEFSMLADRWAQFEISPAEPKNLTAYETGTLSLDINVLAWGELYNSEKKSGTFELRVECGWPCTSHAHIFEIKKLNSWSHIEVSVADMIADGLDITAVNKGIILMPERGRQQGLRFQLDNIKWTKGSVPAVYKNKVYEEHFNAAAGTNGWNFVSLPGYPLAMPPFFDRGLAFYFNTSNSLYENWALEVDLETVIDISQQKVSLQLYPEISAPGASELYFVASDDLGREARTKGMALQTLHQGVWNKISFAVDSVDFIADSGFDSTNIHKLGIRFDANGAFYSAPEPLAKLRIDEIVIGE